VTLTDFIAALGLVSGVTGTVLGVLNFLRDRAKVEVSLQWDMEVTPGTEYDHNKLWGVVSVTNVGRRPSFVSHAALKLPRGYEGTHLVINSGIAGKTLTEAAPSERYVVTQEGLEAYAKDWRDVIAQVNDSRGRVWRSRRLPASEMPSWAKGPANAA
jgi:hypothetical protein